MEEKEIPSLRIELGLRMVAGRQLWNVSLFTLYPVPMSNE